MAIITGTSSADTLNGTVSADEVSGLGGDDTLSGAGGNDTLLGGSGADALAGGAGADSLKGGVGADTLAGGGGNDLYLIDASDTIVDGGGIDTVQAAFSYALLASFEHLVLLGGAAINGTGNGSANSIIGNNGANVLGGGGGNDTLTGGGGNDTLNGGPGADSLEGGAGHDTYIIDALDVLVAGAGIDTVRPGFSYTLLAGFENLLLTGGAAIDGTGNGAANAIIGNNGANRLAGGGNGDTLTGNGGADTLDGGAGNDTLLGGGGEDVLILDAADASVQGGTGIDTLRIDGGGVTLDLTAVANTVHRGIEAVDLAGAGDNSLVLGRSDVIALSSTSDTLRVDGNAGDAVVADGAWNYTQNVVIGAQTYAEYTNGAATLQVDTDIDRSGITVSSMSLGALDGTNGFRLDGIEDLDFSGACVASAGDVNGDGFDDLIIGGLSDPGSGSNFSESYVIFGKAFGFGSSIDLATLDGTNGFALTGIESETFSRVSSAGDVNGDGFGDLIIGAAKAGGVFDYSGEAYVVFGQCFGFASSIDVATLDGTSGFRLDDVTFNALSGRSVASAGDVNGDGFDDLIVGAQEPLSGDFTGKSYVVFGKASDFASSIDFSTLDGTNGFVLTGSGLTVAGSDDVNGDGFDDLLIGEPSSGKSYVVFGKASGFSSSIDLSILNGTNGFVLNGVDGGDAAGGSVASAGDVNGDGFGDLIIGALGADPNGLSYAGESCVVFGKASGFASSIALSALDGTNGFVLNGIDANDRSGISVSSAGDVNGDGFSDVIVGAFFGGDSKGESYVVFGKSSGFASSIDLSSLDGLNGFVLKGADMYDRTCLVSCAGDVNADGFDDLVVGGPNVSPGGRSLAGASYVVFGGDFTGAVTFLGGGGADAMAGSAAAQTFVSGRGHDTIDGGGGADVIRGGAGSDLIRVANLAFADIDGGSGAADTLVILGGDRTLNLTARPNNQITGIERIDLTGSGDNTLRLSHLDLFDLSDTTNRLRVEGDMGDTVDLTGTWTDEGAGATYHTYTLGAATILIDNDIFVM